MAEAEQGGHRRVTSTTAARRSTSSSATGARSDCAPRRVGPRGARSVLRRALGPQLLPSVPRTSDDRRTPRRPGPRSRLARPRRAHRVGRRERRGTRRRARQLRASPRPADRGGRVRGRGRYQARGIGTRLVEQLAARAAAHGIERFVGEVMADNAAMIDVFERVGFEVSRTSTGAKSR